MAVTEPTTDAAAVAHLLLADAMCIECIISKTGLDLDRVFNAIGVLDTNLTVVRTRGCCHLCSKKNRFLLTLA
jgi:hypothetical protein